MRQRGRRSAETGVATVAAVVDRLPVPLHLSDLEGELWRAVVDEMPADWFDPAIAPVLESYCKHAVHARVIDERIAAFDPEWMSEKGGTERYDLLLKMRDRETRALTACARNMRLTQQSKIRPETAGRVATAKTGSGRKPWESD